MYNKKKNKKFKRILALVGVVVIILSALVIPSGAWEVADIPFYNYFDCSKFGTTSEIGDRTNTAQIVSVNPETGFINMYAKFDSTTFCCVPYSDINLKLSEVCPDLVLYESYVLSGEFYYDIEDGEEEIVNAQIVLVREDGSTEPWRIGQSLKISPDLLNSYVTFRAGRCRRPSGRPVSCGFRYWINKDNAAPFEPYDMFKNIKNEAYEQGKNEGYNAGLAEGTEKGYDEGYNFGHADGYSSGFTQGENKGYDDGYKVGREDGLSSGKQMGYDDGYEDGYEANIMDNLMVSKRNLSLQISFYDRSTGETTWKSYGDVNGEELNYPFNGYSFNSRLLDTKYTTAPSGNSFLNGIYVMLIPRSYGANYVVGSSQLSVTSYKDTWNIFYITIISDALGGTSNPVTVRYGTKGAGESILVNFADFGLKDGDVIDSLSIEYREPNESNPIKEGFSFAFTDTSGNAFTVGMEEGKSQGLVEGYKNGYADGNTDGYNIGYEEGHDSGYDSGYADGDNTGYYRGRSDEAKKSGFFGMIYSVIDAPVSVLSQTLNFDILGVNMKGLASSLITFAILVTVVKFFV